MNDKDYLQHVNDSGLSVSEECEQKNDNCFIKFASHLAGDEAVKLLQDEQVKLFDGSMLVIYNSKESISDIIRLLDKYDILEVGSYVERLEPTVREAFG